MAVDDAAFASEGMCESGQAAAAYADDVAGDAAADAGGQGDADIVPS